MTKGLVTNGGNDNDRLRTEKRRRCNRTRLDRSHTTAPGDGRSFFFLFSWPYLLCKPKRSSNGVYVLQFFAHISYLSLTDVKKKIRKITVKSL